MKKKISALIASLLFVLSGLFAQSDNKAGSPYFFVTSKEFKLEDFPLLGTRVKVNIVGSIADVTVTQSYSNSGAHPIEAVYIFPGSTRSAIYSMQMKIGERIIQAKIKEKEQARNQYERARSEGRRASLLEQHKPNVFQMNVANILPGDMIEVELKYTEFLIPESGIYSFIYPTVVGPRFGDQETTDAVPTFVSNPYTTSGTMPSYGFDLIMDIKMAVPIKECLSSTHKLNIDFKSGFHAKAQIVPEEYSGGNRDFIFNFSLTDSKIESGTILYEDGKEKYFLTMIEPPKHFSPTEIPSREYIFVVDVSGSMYGFPLDISKNLMRELLLNLKENDVFNVLLFAGGSHALSEVSLPATEENVLKAIRIIDNASGGGGTHLLPALEKAFEMSNDPDRSSSVVVITDGYVHVEEKAFQLIEQNLSKANVFSFGIGSSVNRYLMEGLAHVGRGEPFIITQQNNAKIQADKFKKYIQNPLLTNISVSFDGFEAFDFYPKSIPDMMAERPLYIFGKYSGENEGNIVIKGTTGGGDYREVIDIGQSQIDVENTSLKHLWAREKIRILSDFNAIQESPERKKEITKLGLEYNLLTKYTSFLAEEKLAVLVNGEKTFKVKQPLPLPKGVSNYAVGFEMGAKSKKLVSELNEPIVNIDFAAYVISMHRPLIKSLSIKFLKEITGIELCSDLEIYVTLSGIEIVDHNQSLTREQLAKFKSILEALVGNHGYSEGLLFTIKAKS